MASLEVIALDPTVPQLRAPGVSDTYHFCRYVEFQDGTSTDPSITNIGDLNTGIYWPNADELGFTTGGVQRLSLGATTVFNETGADVDFRVEGDTNANLLFVDASTDRVGVGLNNPDRLIDVNGSSKFRGQILITSGEPLTLGLQALQLPTGTESTIGAGLSTRTGVAGESIIQFGNNMNTYYTGSVNAAKPGAMIRIDTRGVEPTPGASAYSVFQIQTRAAGVADPNYTVPVQIGAAPQGTFCIQTNGLATFNYGFVVNEGGGDYDTRFEGDTDTHLFFADASTDRIGIGTASPAFKLDVAGTGKVSALYLTAMTAGSGALYYASTRLTLANYNVNGIINFETNGGASAGSIDASQNWGIGTDTPNVRLDVNGAMRLRGSTSGYVGLQAAAVAGTTTYTLPSADGSNGQVLTTNGTGTLSWTTNAGGDVTGPASASDNAIARFDGTTGKLIQNSAVFVDDDGDVGIGTSTPGEKLQIESGTPRIYMNATTNSASAGMYFRVKDGSGNADNSGIYLEPTANIANRYINFSASNIGSDMAIVAGGNVGIGTTSPASRLSVAGSTGTIATFTNGATADFSIICGSSITSLNAGGANILAFQTGGSERMRLDSSGNLGIGTTSPAYKLDIRGAAVGSNFAAISVDNTSGGSGSPANTVSIDFSNSGIVKASITGAVYGDGYMAFATNDNTEKMRLAASGNLGLGVTPSAWNIGKTLELPNGVSLSANSGLPASYLATNARWNSGWIYTTSAAATYYNQQQGAHAWFTAPSGTAGNAITFTQAMTLDASGNLLVGGTTQLYGAAGRGLIQVSGSSQALLGFGTTGNVGLGFLYHTGTNFELTNAQNGYLSFATNNTERARITSGGSFKIGASDAGGTMLGISDGATDPTSYGSVQVTKVVDHDNKWHYACVQAGQEIAGMGFQDNVNQMFVVGRGADPGSTNCIRFAGTDSSTRFLTNGSERARIDSGGDFLVGTTSNIGAGARFAIYNSGGNVLHIQSGNASANNFVSYDNAGSATATLSNGGALTISGALSKGSGSFRIDHPLKPDTHQLVHSFIEGPQADLIYRGKVALVDGQATVNIDESAGMTEGTFVALCREVQCFTSNESDWDAVRGSVSGNILTIECQNQSSTATISWMVIGERQDKHMYETDWTDENGKVIVEPEKVKPVEAK